MIAPIVFHCPTAETAYFLDLRNRRRRGDPPRVLAHLPAGVYMYLHTRRTHHSYCTSTGRRRTPDDARPGASLLIARVHRRRLAADAGRGRDALPVPR